MPQFKIGQRVRMKAIPENFNYVGLCGTVIKLEANCLCRNWLKGEIENVCGYGVEFDNVLAPYGLPFIVEAFRLEPLYDGDQKVSWTDCAWRPDMVRA